MRIRNTDKKDSVSENLLFARYYYLLVGFGRACAPAARALRAPVFLGSLPRQTGRCVPPPPIAAALLQIKSVELGLPTSRAFFFPQEHLGYEICCPPAPRVAHRSFADPSGNILGSKLCTGAAIHPIFLVYLFYSFWIFSFYYPLPFLLSFLILLILLYLSLLILLQYGPQCTS